MPAKGNAEWKGIDGVSPADFRELVPWVFDVVGRPAPPIYLPPPPPPPPEPPPAWSDLPLFHGERT